MTVTFTCYDSSYDTVGAWELDAGAPNFRPIWRGARSAESCEAARSTVREWTPLERKALKAAVRSVDPTTMWTICSGAAVDILATDYASADFTPSADEMAEIRGALVLCPTAPTSKALRASLERGRQLASGTFINGDGNYAVPKEVKPGTYVTTGSVSDCYWERVDDNGGTIDNGFVTGAPRVRVTIESGDAGFNTQDCGQWRQE